MSLAIALLLSLLLPDAKIAVTSTGPKPESEAEARFGRARWYLIYDPAGRSWEAVDNSQAAQAPGGAGTQAADMLARRGVTVVITGECGPKALRVLSSAGIKLFQAAGRTVTKALRDYEAGRLAELR
jgi:predicted Fe-Mo cluster-binding NifX family protein